jgi:hypothetical protein
MTHPEVVAISVGAHFGVLTLAALSFFKYGFRSGEFRTWLEDTDKTLKNMRRKISVGLGEKLNSVFDAANRVVSEILGANGEYSDKTVDPRGSEDYRNALFDFVENNVEEMADYRSLMLVRARWWFWTRYLSWSILALMVIEVIFVGTIGLDKLGCCTLPDRCVYWSFIATGFGVANCFCGLVLSLFHHNGGTKYLEQYNEF